MLRTLLAVICLQLCLPALACEEFAEKLATQLYGSAPADDAVPRFSDCAIWPDDAGSTAIVILARFQAGSGFDAAYPASGLYDLDVLLVDVKEGKILNRLLQKGALTSDAVVLSSIAIDAGEIALAPGKRAFGVRVRHSHPKRYYPHEFETLNLYIAQGKTLLPVVTDFESSNSGGEASDCSGYLVDIQRTLGPAKSKTKGLADLVATTERVKTTMRQVKGECVETTGRTSVTRQTLRFDGTAYSRYVPGKREY